MSSLEQDPSPKEQDSLAAILSTIDHLPASYLVGARKLAALGEHPRLMPVRLAILSTFTLDPIVPYLRVEGARRDLAIQPSVMPFGQLEQQVLVQTSELYASNPSAIVVALRVEELCAELVDEFVALKAEQIDAAISFYVERVTSIVGKIRENSRAHVIVWNQAAPARLAAGFADTSLEPSQQDAFADLNRRLKRAVLAAGGTVFDVARLAAEVGLRQWYDPKLQYLGRIPMSGQAQIAAAKRLARHIRSLSRAPCKCLVLDLDNTLWGGVLGEDGVGGIALGEDYPGNVFKAFQRAIRSYRDRGVLLAIASKNNEPDVVEAFSHPDMILKLDDFAARQIHWQDKASSLRAIAKELNIGIDSLAFFDDNPVERGWVKEQLPEVNVIDVPREALKYVQALDESGAFDHLSLTDEDRARGELYRGEIRRRDLQASTGSIEEFLRTLEMKVVVEHVNATNIARVVQLLSKTNQFNVTTRRHTLADLEALLARAGSIGLVIRVTDRFGDNGLVGVALAVREGDAYALDTFLMSCRVLGRQVEHALFGEVAKRAVAQGARTFEGEFIPTKKNAPSANFFAEMGFSKAEGRDNFWRLDLTSVEPAAATLFEIIDQTR